MTFLFPFPFLSNDVFWSSIHLDENVIPPMMYLGCDSFTNFSCLLVFFFKFFYDGSEKEWPGILQKVYFSRDLFVLFFLVRLGFWMLGTAEVKCPSHYGSCHWPWRPEWDCYQGPIHLWTSSLPLPTALERHCYVPSTLRDERCAPCL